MYASFLFLLFSCQNESGQNRVIRANNNGNTAKPTVKGPLSGKTKSEILKLKYNEAIVICNLWLQHSVNYDPSIKPTEVFTWDLFEELKINPNLNIEKTISFPSKLDLLLPDQKLKIDLQLKSIQFGRNSYTDTDGSQYKMSYSPILQFKYILYSEIKMKDASVSKVSNQGADSIIENIFKTSVNYIFSSDHEENKFYNQLTCTVKTVIKKEFQDQFLKIDSNKN